MPSWKSVVACLLLLALAGCSGVDTDDFDEPVTYLDATRGPTVTTRLDVARTTVRWLDLKDGDEWDNTVFRPVLNVSNWREGLCWQLEGSGRFSTEDELDDATVDAEFDGFDILYRLGYGWKPASHTTVYVLTGPVYHFTSIEFSATPASSGGMKYDCSNFAWSLGTRVVQTFSPTFRFFGEASAEAALNGRADFEETSESAVGDLEEGFGVGARSGLEWKIKENMHLGAGLFVDYYQYEYEGAWAAEDSFESYGVFGSVRLKF